MLAKQLAWFLRQTEALRVPGSAKELQSGQGGAPSRECREICLERQTIAYELRQGRGRRRLSLSIDERGLRVGAPARIPQQRIDAFIQEHAAWVLTRLEEYQQRLQRRQLLLQEGTHLPWLGGTLVLHFDSRARHNRWQMSALQQADAAAALNRLWLGLAADAAPALVRQRLRLALQQEARQLFAARLLHHAQIMQLTPPALALSSARTRWGSCSRRSGIRLNWRLMHLPLALIDYVVVHELAHLVEMNHSARFWQVVAGVYPDWQAARLALKQQGQDLPLL